MKFELKECVTGAAAELETTAEVCVSGGRLALLFRAEQVVSRPKYNEDNKPLYEGDVVEIFLALGENRRYLELEFNRNGAIFSAVVENDGEERTLTFVNGRKYINLSVESSETVWITRAEIDIKWLESLGFSEDYAYGNLLREDFDEADNMSIYAASPTYAETFHKPEAFVKLL